MFSAGELLRRSGGDGQDVGLPHPVRDFLQGPPCELMGWISSLFEVIRRLHFEYLQRGYRETGMVAVSAFNLTKHLRDMAWRGQWKGFFTELAQAMKESTALRDFIDRERVLKGFLLAWLGLSNHFLVDRKSVV